MREGRRDAWIAVAIALGVLFLYVLTLAPDVVDGDGGEFQFAAWNFAFVHPTGYPLYLLIGGLFQHLFSFASTPAYWLNLFTAICAVGAVVVLYFIVREVGAGVGGVPTRFARDASRGAASATGHWHGAAAVAALSFAVTRTFWYDALAAEVYAPHALFLAALLFLALRWQATRDAEMLAWFGFVFGLALTHHRAVVLWIPAVGLFFGAVAWKSRFKFQVSRFQGFRFHVLRFMLYTLAPLFLYLYIPLRAPMSPYATIALAPDHKLVLYDSSVAGFLNYVLGRTFAFELGWDAVSAARLVAFPQMLIDQFTLVGVALGLIGLIAMVWCKEWERLVLLVVGALVSLLFASLYHIGDIASYYVPVYLVWAVWVGVGLSWLVASCWSLVTSRWSLVTRYLPVLALFLTFFLLPYNQLSSNLPHADRSNETDARGAWLRYLETPVPKNAILISNDRDEMMPLWYLQYVEQRRRDVVGLFPLITSAPEHANVGRLIDSALDLGRSVYLIKAMPGIETKFWLGSEGKLIRVVGRTTETPPAIESAAVIAGQIAVKGYDVMREQNILRVAIFWQARTKLNQNYTAFVHLLDSNGNKIAQGNDHQVGGEYYPSRLWDAGEVLRDEHAMLLPDNLAAGTYRLVVGMYGADRGLLGEAVEVGSVEVKR